MALPALRVGLALTVVCVACGNDSTGGGGSSDASAETGTVTSGVCSGAGAGVAVKTGFVGSQSITVDGDARTYELFVPDGYDGKKTFPVVFVFHGDGGTGTGIRGGFNMETESQGGAIFVYPDGENQTWQIDDAAGLRKDVAFVDAMAADLVSTHCTDASKVFAVGFSKGAYFTNQLACISKSHLRAVVTHSGGGPFYIDNLGMKFDDNGNLVCPSSPGAALQIQGDADDTVPVSEGEKARTYWLAANGCGTTTQSVDPSPCVSYDGCATGRPEVWCEIPGLGHAIWPTNAVTAAWGFVKGK